MRRAGVIAALLMLAACGVDGPPQPPAPQAGLPASGVAASGVAVSGDAQVGVTGGTR
ncbi:MAG: hypothetical protein MUF73_06085 [Rhodobacteraceae bacterium]|jgi:hypothetical protein|nr:hypothetical protein [Paracoccaceae bacterium]